MLKHDEILMKYQVNVKLLVDFVPKLLTRITTTKFISCSSLYQILFIIIAVTKLLVIVFLTFLKVVK